MSAAIAFFASVQNLYTFFAASTHRWNILLQKLAEYSAHQSERITLKRLSGTRWSACADATRALLKGYRCIKFALDELNCDSETLAVRQEAACLSKQITSFEFAILLVTWPKILNRLNATSKSLQSTMSLDRVVSLYHSLVEYMKTVRQSFDSYEVETKQLTTNHEYASDTKRRRMSKKFFDDHDNGGEKDAAEQFSGIQKLVVQTFYVIVDQLIVELEKRQKAYVDISSRFGFLICDPNTAMPLDQVRKSASALQQHYADE